MCSGALSRFMERFSFKGDGNDRTVVLKRGMYDSFSRGAEVFCRTYLQAIHFHEAFISLGGLDKGSVKFVG